MEEKSHVLKVLKKVNSALTNQDYVKVKQLSEEILHSSSIHQDPDIISVAVIIYSLSKLIERDSYKQEKNWQGFYSSYIKALNNSIEALEKDNIQAFRTEISFIRELIEKLSGRLKKYIEDVFRRAKINKASRLYEHGISMEKTAKILGVSLWELAEYSGKTGVADVNLSVTMSIKDRIKIVEEIFRK
ncbi:hypothetical protein GOV14_06245 [Candidatus Pacearchaeota archaeon]|nr:hypothetical protein [Candidatus Pacearchaeota archaeon]